MKHIVLLTALIISSNSLSANPDQETCRSFAYHLPTNTKYCLLDQDEKIREFDEQLLAEKNKEWINGIQKDDPTLFPERPKEQQETQ